MGTTETSREQDRVTRPQEIGEALYKRLSVDGAAALGHTRSANFDAVRAIAALMVLAAHAYAFSATSLKGFESSVVVRSFSSGIALFFVLSGFLISGPFLRALLDGREAPATGRYAIRRAARILPGYWIALVAAVALVTSSQLVHWWQVPVHASLMQTLALGEPNRLLFVAWTLSMEVMFYIFVPLATFVAWRAMRGRRLSLNQLAGGVLALGAASVAWLFITKAIVTPHAIATGELPREARLLGWVLPNYLYAFVPGALIYLAETSEAQARGGVWARYRQAKERPELLALGAILMLAVSVTIVKTTRNALVYSVHDITLAFGAGLGVMAFTGDGPRRRAAARLLAPIGLISYGIYLWHAVIRGALEQHALSWVPGVGGGIFAWPFQIAFLLGLTVPIALGSWLLVERPLLRRTATWDRRRRAAREASAARPAHRETTARPQTSDAA